MGGSGRECNDTGARSCGNEIGVKRQWRGDRGERRQGGKASPRIGGARCSVLWMENRAPPQPHFALNIKLFRTGCSVLGSFSRRRRSFLLSSRKRTEHRASPGPPQPVLQHVAYLMDIASQLVSLSSAVLPPLSRSLSCPLFPHISLSSPLHFILPSPLSSPRSPVCPLVSLLSL